MDYASLAALLPRYSTQPADILGAIQQGQSLRSNNMRLDEMQREQQAGASLRELLSRPGADIGSDDTLRQVAAIDPSTALSFRKLNLDAQRAQAETSRANLGAQSDKVKLATTAAQQAYAQWKSLPPDQQASPQARDAIMRQAMQFVGLPVDPSNPPSWDHMAALATADSQRQLAGMGGFAPVPVMQGGKVVYAFPGRDGSMSVTGYEKPPESSVISTAEGYQVVPKIPGMAAQPAQSGGQSLYPPAKQEFSDKSGQLVTIPAAGSGQKPTAAQIAQPAATLEMNSKNQANARTVLDLVGNGSGDDPATRETDALVKASTGSYLGVGRDLAGRVVGASTEGGKAGAQLQVLAGKLVSMMPRMEGPQSNADVALYKEMAGRIGDTSIPWEQKLAALQQVRQLALKYQSQQPQSAAPSSGMGAIAQDPRAAQIKAAFQAGKLTREQAKQQLMQLQGLQ